MAEEKSGREKTLRAVAEGLMARPAYLLLFGLGLMASGIVLAAILNGDPKSLLYSIFSWLLFLVGSVAVVAWNEASEKNRDGDFRGIPDGDAEEAFFGGADASYLSGFWRASWKIEEGEPHDADEEDRIYLVCEAASIFGSSLDDKTGKSYWMFGRLSDREVVTLNYWSTLQKGYNGLTGCVVLEIDESLDARGRKMKGTWSGMGKNGKLVRGITEWEKLG